MENALWEPGHTEVVKLKVVNEGSLALKYQLGVNVVSEIGSKTKDGVSFKLSEFIKFGLVDGDQDYTRDQAVNAVDATAIALQDTYNSDILPLLPKNDTNTDNEDIVTMVVYMPTTVENEANHGKGEAVPTINLGLKLLATQLVHESDSFGPDYDEKAKPPFYTTTSEETKTVDGVTVTIPKGAPAGTYDLSVKDLKLTRSKFNCDISLTCNGEPVEPIDGVTYPVDIQLDYMLDIHELRHNGEVVADYDYDPLENVISFETESFSPFEIDYTRMGKLVKVENRKLTAGVYDVGYDPVDYDPSLKEEGSEYIAVSYKKNGEDCFVVGPRDATVILSADADGEYTPEYDNHDIAVSTNASGKLYSHISKFANNDHSVVCLLPGTYKEGTTINVSSSMTIVGLGDKDSVKVIKQSSSKSNRHLFNCNGTKADYIEVGLDNLYLDATAKTTINQDNAAVQSIRKTKVKCHDLTIVKGTGWDAIAFYVNGNNAVDGVKHPAYLYAEDCALNATGTFGVVTTSGTYKFFHDGLTYNNGNAYTNNSGSNLNKFLFSSNWEWK